MAAGSPVKPKGLEVRKPSSSASPASAERKKVDPRLAVACLPGRRSGRAQNRWNQRRGLWRRGLPPICSVPGDRTDELWATILDSEKCRQFGDAVGTYDLPSITDRNELIARHGDPEVGAIPLLKRKSICFLAAPAALDRSWRRVADARSR